MPFVSQCTYQHTENTFNVGAGFSAINFNAKKKKKRGKNESIEICSNLMHTEQMPECFLTECVLTDCY